MIKYQKIINTDRCSRPKRNMMSCCKLIIFTALKMGGEKSHYVDLNVEHRDLNRLIMFWETDLTARNYIDRNIRKISHRLGFPDVISFAELVEAYHQAKIDTINASYQLSTDHSTCPTGSPYNCNRY